MAVQGLAVKLRDKKEKYRQWKPWMVGLGRIQGCYLDMQRWDQESQGVDGIEPGEGCEK